MTATENSVRFAHPFPSYLDLDQWDEDSKKGMTPAVPGVDLVEALKCHTACL